MHGHHGFGHWGGHCGGGWGFGWFFPALLIGRLISDSVPRPQGWPYPPQPFPGPQGQPQSERGARPEQAQASTAAPKAAARCDNCSAQVDRAYAFCPHCGEKLAHRVCRYCNQDLEPGATHCGHCGGSVK